MAMSGSAEQPLGQPDAKAGVTACDDPRMLLQPRLDISVPEWIGALGERRAFRVRGFSWFREAVPLGIAALAPFLPEVRTTLEARPGWTALSFPWAEPFSLRQVYDAANREPVLFAKAAKTILLCEIAAAANQIDLAELYRNMRIESAVYRIADFDRGRLDQAESEREDILRILVRECAQETGAVFYDLADGKTVSLRLAARTHTILRRELPRLKIGGVVIGRDRKYRHASGKETVEGWSIPDDVTAAASDKVPVGPPENRLTGTSFRAIRDSLPVPPKPRGR